MTATLSRFIARYWGLAVLLLWGGLALWLGQRAPYGLDEGAARALLLNWSVAGDVVNPIVIFGVPDFRALIFIPLGIYWSGSLIAAKVFTLLITFAAATLLYRWSRRSLNQETALVATGLLLIAPLTLVQADALAAGPYLLLMFGLGVWLDHGYRAEPRPLGGRYFTQMLLVATTVTLHPAGLAYPAALLWHWYKNPLDTRQQRHMYIGVTLAVLFALLLQAGWHGLSWWRNPLMPLAAVLLGSGQETGAAVTVTGLLVAVLAVLVIALNARKLLDDFMGAMLVLALLFGAAAADDAWAMLTLVVILYYGLPKLIAFNESLGSPGYVGKRGGVFALLVIAATWFMTVDRNYYQAVQQEWLSPHDRLIHTLVTEQADKKSLRVASQWPARTMIACKCEVLPLPPAAKDGETLLTYLKGITHIVVDPSAPENRKLGLNIAEVGGRLETVALQPGGVILKVR